MELTKKYRVVYYKQKMTLPLEEFESDSTTYVQEGMNGAEFDTREEAELFIKEKGLVYEYPTED